MNQRSRPSRWSSRGITIVELVVVLTILTVLASVVSLGVMAARESSRRLQCQNNLHQTRLALSNFETTYRRFPGFAEHSQKAIRQGTPVELSAFVALLPFLEVEFEYRDSQLRVGVTVDDFELPPKVFSCPSSSRRLGYRLNAGPTAASAFRRSRSLTKECGFFRVEQPLRAKEIDDGLSMTVAISERIAIEPYAQTPAAVASPANHFSSGDFLSYCEDAAARRDMLLDPGDRFNWWAAGQITVMYDHWRPPNDSVTDCHGISWAQQPPLLLQTIAARSGHSGGVFSLTADGAVHWIANSIDRQTWQGMSTPAGSETAAVP